MITGKDNMIIHFSFAQMEDRMICFLDIFSKNQEMQKNTKRSSQNPFTPLGAKLGVDDLFKAIRRRGKSGGQIRVVER